LTEKKSTKSFSVKDGLRTGAGLSVLLLEIGLPGDDTTVMACLSAGVSSLKGGRMSEEQIVELVKAIYQEAKPVPVPGNRDTHKMTYDAPTNALVTTYVDDEAQPPQVDVIEVQASSCDCDYCNPKVRS
jgi:hypothetical protein